MKKSAEFERPSDFDIRNGKQESDFIRSFAISRIVFPRIRSRPGSARNDHDRVGKSQILKEKFSCSYPVGKLC